MSVQRLLVMVLSLLHLKGCRFANSPDATVASCGCCEDGHRSGGGGVEDCYLMMGEEVLQFGGQRLVMTDLKPLLLLRLWHEKQLPRRWLGLQQLPPDYKVLCATPILPTPSVGEPWQVLAHLELKK